MCLAANNVLAFNSEKWHIAFPELPESDLNMKTNFVSD